MASSPFHVTARASRFGLGVALLLSFGVLGASRSFAVSGTAAGPVPPRYRLTDLGFIGQNRFFGADINEGGRIAGRLTSSQAALWTPTSPNSIDGSLSEIPPAAGRQFAHFLAINDDSIAVGESYWSGEGQSSGSLAFYRDAASVALAGQRSQATDINVAGQIVGGAYVPDRAGRAAYWDDTGLTYLASVNGDNHGGYGLAHSINDSGVIAGQEQFSTGSAYLWHAVKWTNGAIQDLHALTGHPMNSSQSYALGNNNLDHTIGYLVDPANGGTRGYRWEGGTATDLGDFAGGPCIPLDINDSDQIVGAAAERAILIEDGATVDLNTLIAPGGQYTLRSASAINNTGQIVARGLFSGSGADRGVLLTPYSKLRADLAATLTAAPNPVLVNGTLTYNGTVKNNGPESATGVKAVFTLPAGVDVVSTTPASVLEGGTLTFTLGSLANGDELDLEVVVQPLAAGTLAARLQVSAWEGDPVAANNSVNRNVTARTASANLVLTGTDTPDPQDVGGVLIYRLGIRNAGPDPATDVVVTLPLSALTLFQSVETDHGTARHDPPNVIAELGSLAKDEAALVTITVLAQSAGIAETIPTAAADQADPQTSNNRVTLKTTLRVVAADLAATLTGAPNPVVVGQNLTYSGNVRNNGSRNATGVKADFTLPAGVELVSTNPAATRTGDVLTFELGALNNANNAAVGVVVRPTEAGVLIARLVASANEVDPNQGNNTVDRSITARAPSADVSVTGTDSPDPLDVGGVLTYKLTVKNTGPDPATSVVLTQPLSALTQFQTVETNRGTARHEGPNVIAEIGALAKNETALITVTVLAQTAGTAQTILNVVAAETDPNTGNNHPTLSTVIKTPLRPNLSGNWDKLEAKKKGKGKKLKYLMDATAKITNDGNAGAGASKLRFFLSTDRTRSKDDAPLTVNVNGQELPVEIPVDALAAGASKAIIVSQIKVSKKDYTVKLKGKYLLGVVDFAGTVTESNETDNVFPKKGDMANPL